MGVFLCGHLFAFLLGRYLGAQSLGRMVTRCLTVGGTARLVSRVAAPASPSSSQSTFPHATTAQTPGEQLQTGRGSGAPKGPGKGNGRASTRARNFGAQIQPVTSGTQDQPPRFLMPPADGKWYEALPLLLAAHCPAGEQWPS